MVADFKEDFTVDGEWPRNYEQFIQRLRRQVGGSVETHGLPMLLPPPDPEVQPPQPIRWFEVVLRANECSVTLRIRRHDLYLVGYQMHNSNQWLELARDGDPQQIAGSTFLGFRGDYNALASAAHVDINTINLGQNQLINAVIELSRTTDYQSRARQLIIIIHTVCESTRYIPISHHLATLFGPDNPGSPLTPWKRALVTSWGFLSDEVRREDADPMYRIRETYDLGIRSVFEAASILGVVLYPCYHGPVVDRRPRRMANVNGQMCGLGRPLVEVFSVRINNISGEDPGDLYGTITVNDGLSSQFIYNRTRDNYESIKPQDTALLIGPARSILAYGSFKINVDLKDKETFQFLDHEVSKGEIIWDVYSSSDVYDKPIDRNVDGKDGSTTVSYIVLSDAVEATVEITLVKGGSEDLVEVYGLLTAQSGKFMNESVLFRKASDKYISVTPGQLIPLSRSVVAIPSDSSIIVRADLWDYDPISDDKIAQGTAEFPAEFSGSYEKHISGGDGDIIVKVTWKS